jgi:hypothetical protein
VSPGQRSGLFDTGAVQRASKAVVGVSFDLGTCTGWMITEDLVVIPDTKVVQAGGPDAQFRCWFGAEVVVPAEVVFRPAPDSAHGPALLRLTSVPTDVDHVPLETRAADPGDPIALLFVRTDDPEPLRVLSVGRLLDMESPWLHHDADVVEGAVGAAVVSERGALLSMHLSHDDTVRTGLTLEALLSTLRNAPLWPEIGTRHNLADVGVARRRMARALESSPSDRTTEALQHAAVHWSLDPATISPDSRERVRPLVNNSSAARWSLASTERARLLTKAGSLGTLRRIRGDEVIDDPRQAVIDRILQGPPYDLHEVAEADLPYWLQAVRWFAGVEPALPKPSEVSRVLERRRLRGRLATIAGWGFRGRENELALLAEWYEQHADDLLVISGLGGIGKSALVARFADGLASDTPLFWLDFDRADLAPDDGDSVVSLLTQQASLQVENFRPDYSGAETWQQSAQAFGAALARGIGDAAKPLLVLDGFEVAQHVERYQEIWKVLDAILAHVPALRILVDGRSEITGTTVRDRPARGIVLRGIDRADADLWLLEHGVDHAAVRAGVLDVVAGVPLRMRLALRFLEEGGDPRELLDELPKRLIEGFLYRRILDRVMDVQLLDIARNALVLRRITPALIASVLSENIPVNMSAEQVFERLRREMGLVTTEVALDPAVVLRGDEAALLLRPEVRTATLALLEIDDRARVRGVDERAAEWYAQGDPEDIANRAELVYHRLRLGDVDGAAADWRDEVAALLVDAEDDLPESAPEAREWLVSTRGRVLSSWGTDIAGWERDADRRIRDALGRGRPAVVPEILAERAERTGLSPLVLFDAWVLWYGGDITAAWNLLQEAGVDDRGPVGRHRAVLAALLAVRSDEHELADTYLERIQSPDRWADRELADLESLGVWAARVRLTVDLYLEGLLAQAYELSRSDMLLQVMAALRPADVVLPTLAQQLEEPARSAARQAPLVPVDESQIPAFRAALAQEREDRSGEERMGRWLLGGTSWWQFSRELRGEVNGSYVGGFSGLVRQLSFLADRRWQVAATGLSLGAACQQALQPDASAGPLSLSVVATLGALRGQPLRYSDRGVEFATIDDLIDECVRRDPTAAALVEDGPGALLTATTKLFLDDADPQRSQELESWLAHGPAPTQGVSLYLRGPDPLESLFRRIAGLPEVIDLPGSE